MDKLPIVYQIYPKSFNDTDGDGWGDIPGIIEKLDYIKDLGVDMIWLTPIFESPQKDNGYDVSNYLKINPKYGTMDDVDTLIHQAKIRGIGIMFDMVFNHTSTEHEWFKRAKHDTKYRNYYIFNDKPTNWVSKFGGNAWKYDEDYKAYYLHLFDETQADLNWKNPEVFEELVKVTNFWIDKGIKGFRFDVINLISKPSEYQDDYEGDGRRFYTDGKHVHEYLNNLNRRSFGKFDDIVTVGELSSTTIENGVKYASPLNNELTTIFNFHHLKVDYKNGDKWALKPFDFIEYKRLMSEWQYAMQEHDATMSLFLNNHDQPRSVSRFGDVDKYHYESATMLATSTFLMRGMPYIYQGEEIGLPNAHFRKIEEYRDVESINYYKILKKRVGDTQALEILRHRSRDNGRTPMPWDNSENSGFTNGEPWLQLSQSRRMQSVAENEADDLSILNYYKKLISFRKQNEVVISGHIKFEYLQDKNLMVYTRELRDEKIEVIANFYSDPVNLDFEISADSIILNNYYGSDQEKTITMMPYQVIVRRIES